MLPPIGIACAVLLLVAITQLRRIFRFADQLIAREAEPRIPGGEDGLVPFHIFYEQLKLEIASLGDGADALAIHSVCFEGLEDLDDGFGEGSAEAFMRIAALRLRAACREGTLLTRHVGNSIAILSLGSNGVEAEALSGRLVQTMSSPVALEGGLVNFHCAVGSVVVDERGADPDDVLHKAEAACRKVVMV
jgi:GGDEF domain-containing protein